MCACSEQISELSLKFVLFSALKGVTLECYVLLTLHQCVSTWHFSQNVKSLIDALSKKY